MTSTTFFGTDNPTAAFTVIGAAVLHGRPDDAGLFTIDIDELARRLNVSPREAWAASYGVIECGRGSAGSGIDRQMVLSVDTRAAFEDRSFDFLMELIEDEESTPTKACDDRELGPFEMVGAAFLGGDVQEGRLTTTLKELAGRLSATLERTWAALLDLAPVAKVSVERQSGKTVSVAMSNPANPKDEPKADEPARTPALNSKAAVAAANDQKLCDAVARLEKKRRTQPPSTLLPTPQAYRSARCI